MKRLGLIVKQQKLNDIYSSFTFWDYMNTFYPQKDDYLEIPEPEKEEKAEEYYALIDLLEKGIAKYLTKRERQAFDLVFVKEKTLIYAASKMLCSTQRVSQLVQSAYVKIRKEVLKKVAS